MVFADIPEEKEFKEFEPIRFVKIQAGSPVRLRVLDKKAYNVKKHYLPQQKISILCLGDEVCPVCNNNQKLIEANPDVKYNQIKGLIPRQNRYLVNVLNRSLVKVDGFGNVVFPQSDGQFPQTYQGQDITKIEPQPLNRVEVLERGSTLFSQLNITHDGIRDPKTNEPLGLWNYDIQISATGQGRKMVTNVVALPHINDVVEVDANDLYALPAVPIQLTADEIWELLKGTSLSDIFTARRDDDRQAVEEDDERLSELEKDVLEEVNESVNGLFEG
jgi:hypothetical protein